MVSRSWSRVRRLALAGTVVAVVGAAAVFAVWLVGLDAAWAVAAVVTVGAVGAVLASLEFGEEVAWEPPGRDPPRGVRLTIRNLEASLAACDRLARPTVARRLRALVVDEREDRMARAAIVRPLRALLVAELRGRGGAPAPSQDEALLALVGPDATAVLPRDDEDPVTSAAIARCLDAVDRLAAAPRPSR